MSDKYEGYIAEIEQESTPGDRSLDVASDAMGFVLALHTMFAENGYTLPNEPDTDALMAIIDGIHAELAAACLFLSDPAFEQVPTVLRQISKSLSQLDTDFTDTDGVTETSVPSVVKKGFSRLAARIEATKVQQVQMKDILQRGVK